MYCRGKKEKSGWKYRVKIVKFFWMNIGSYSTSIQVYLPPSKLLELPSSNIPRNPGGIHIHQKKIISLVTTSGPQGETCRINRTRKKQVQPCWLLGEEGHRLGWNERKKKVSRPNERKVKGEREIKRPIKKSARVNRQGGKNEKNWRKERKSNLDISIV